MEAKGQIPDFGPDQIIFPGKLPGEQASTLSPLHRNAYILPPDDDKTDPDSSVIGLVTGTHPDTYFTDQGVWFKMGALQGALQALR